MIPVLLDEARDAPRQLGAQASKRTAPGSSCTRRCRWRQARLSLLLQHEKMHPAALIAGDNRPTLDDGTTPYSRIAVECGHGQPALQVPHR